MREKWELGREERGKRRAHGEGWWMDERRYPKAFLGNRWSWLAIESFFLWENFLLSWKFLTLQKQGNCYSARFHSSWFRSWEFTFFLVHFFSAEISSLEISKTLSPSSIKCGSRFGDKKIFSRVCLNLFECSTGGSGRVGRLMGIGFQFEKGVDCYRYLARNLHFSHFQLSLGRL